MNLNDLLRTVRVVWNKINDGNCELSREEANKLVDSFFDEEKECFDKTDLDRLQSFLLKKSVEQQIPKDDTVDNIDERINDAFHKRIESLK